MAHKLKPETIVSNNLAEYAEQIGGLVIRLHSGRVRVRGGSMYLNPEGVVDRLFVFPFPELDFLEVKKDEKALYNWYLQNKSEAIAQRAFMDKLTALGYSVRISFSVEDYLYQRANKLSYSGGFRHEHLFHEKFL